MNGEIVNYRCETVENNNSDMNEELLMFAYRNIIKVGISSSSGNIIINQKVRNK